MQENYDSYVRQTFVYGTGWIALPGIGVVVNTLNILADAPFECRYITIAVTQAGVLVANWAGTVQLDDTAVGRTLFNAAQPCFSVGGSGQLPFPLNPPRCFAQNSSVVISVANPVAVATNVFVSLIGNKLWPPDTVIGQGL